MRILGNGLLIALGVLLLHTPSTAQLRLEPGDRIRIVVESDSASARRTFEGEIVTAFTDELTLRTTADGPPRSIDVHSIRELYGFRPRSVRAAAWRGARFGAFVGLGLGAIAGPVISTTGVGGPLEETILVTSAAGAALGAIAGAIAGSAMAEDGWERYGLPAPWISLDRPSGAWRVSIQVR